MAQIKNNVKKQIEIKIHATINQTKFSAYHTTYHTSLFLLLYNIVTVQTEHFQYTAPFISFSPAATAKKK